MGRSIPFNVKIENKKDKSIVIDKEFYSLCVVSGDEKSKTRNIGKIYLPAGKYLIQIKNLEAQLDLKNIKTTLFIHPGNAK